MQPVKNMLHHNKQHHTDGAHQTTAVHTENPREHGITEGTHREHHSHGAGAPAGGTAAYEASHHHQGGVVSEHHAHDMSHATTAGPGAETTATGPVPDVRPAAESGNNFPGTNPHPEHSALGSMTGKGLAFSGKE